MNVRTPGLGSPSVGPAGPRLVSIVETVAIQILSAPITLELSPSTGGAPERDASGRWPLMLTRLELCEYLGLSWRTLKKVLTVPPVDVGANVVRYSRDQIDVWVATRPALGRQQVREEPVGDDDTGGAVAAALERARRRGARG